MSKQPEEALVDANDAIRLDPRHSEAYKLRGGVLGGLGKRDQAVADFRKALELNPGDEAAKKSLRSFGVDP
jgi:Flp pilus assembly protein TadD